MRQKNNNKYNRALEKEYESTNYMETLKCIIKSHSAILFMFIWGAWVLQFLAGYSEVVEVINIYIGVFGTILLIKVLIFHFLSNDKIENKNFCIGFFILAIIFLVANIHSIHKTNILSSIYSLFEGTYIQTLTSILSISFLFGIITNIYRWAKKEIKDDEPIVEGEGIRYSSVQDFLQEYCFRIFIFNSTKKKQGEGINWGIAIIFAVIEIIIFLSLAFFTWASPSYNGHELGKFGNYVGAVYLLLVLVVIILLFTKFKVITYQSNNRERVISGVILIVFALLPIILFFLSEYIPHVIASYGMIVVYMSIFYWLFTFYCKKKQEKKLEK